jgi:hypothetical protein
MGGEKPPITWKVTDRKNTWHQPELDSQHQVVYCMCFPVGNKPCWSVPLHFWLPRVIYPYFFSKVTRIHKYTYIHIHNIHICRCVYVLKPSFWRQQGRTWGLTSICWVPISGPESIESRPQSISIQCEHGTNTALKWAE